MLRQHVGEKRAGRVFEARNGSPISGQNILKRVLYPLLKRLELPKAGLHAFRHSRVTMLRKNGTPEDLGIPLCEQRTGIHTLTKSLNRRLAASKVGLDFVVGPNGPKIGECVAQ